MCVFRFRHIETVDWDSRRRWKRVVEGSEVQRRANRKVSAISMLNDSLLTD